MRIWNLWLGLTALLSLGLCGAVQAAPSSSAIAALAQQFDKHPLIMIGERHRSREIHAFLQQLLRDPEFICRADDIVVEFGNSRLQDLADKYASGGNITDVQLQSLWRATAVPLTWNSPVYRQFYETVRSINQHHLCKHTLRILLADPPLDWSKIKTVQDYEKFIDRDGSYAGVVEREVLSKHHRALLVAGAAHAWKQIAKGTDFDEPNAAELIERKHPGSLFCLVTVPTRGAAESLQMGPPPSFKVVRGSTLESADYGIVGPEATATLITVNGKPSWKLNPAKGWPRMGKVVDGLLYLGGDATSLYPSSAIYLDPVYQRELRRRAAIIKAYSGQDFTPVIDGLVKDAEQARKH